MPLVEKEKARLMLENHVDWLANLGTEQMLINEFKAIVNYLFIKNDTKGLAQLNSQIKKLNNLRNDSISVF